LSFYDQQPRSVRDLDAADRHVYLEVFLRRVLCEQCKAVKRERLDWLADNPRYTKRFAFAVGRRSRTTTIQDVADEFDLSWRTVKDLDKQYMAQQLHQAGEASPSVIGVDEIAVGPGHTYRIVVSDLERKRPIWFGGKDRSEASMDEFFHWLGPAKSGRIRLAVMDMWKAFRASTLKADHAPQARIIYDKFHVLRHLSDALDQVRRREYARLKGKGRQFIKGQRYTLLSRWENLNQKGRESLQLLFRVNRRLYKAYLLKEQFGQLWDCETATEGRRFFFEWKESLLWQRLDPYREFAAMVQRHWDGIVSFCDPQNKVSLGFVEGFNNKIRSLQKRAYGFHDEEYFRLKILTCMLPKL
jgi:transposase